MTGTPAYLENVVPTPPSADKLTHVRELCELLHDYEAEATRLEKELDRAKKRILELSQREIPDAMDEAGIDHLGLPDKWVDIKIVPWYKASLPKETTARSKAIDWLIEHNHADLIKNEVSVAFTRGEHNQALDIAAQLRDRLPDHEVVVKEDIHHMTFTAFVREQVEAGEVVPLDLLGAQVGRVAKIVKRD